MLTMGIDVGTSSCKVGVFSDKGLAASAGCDYDVVARRPGWVEIDPETTWAKIKRAVREVTDDPSVDGRAIRAVSFSSMGEAVVPVRLDGTIAGPSILGHDCRGVEESERLVGAFDPAALFAVNPNTVGPQYTFAKLMWLRGHDAEAYGRADKFLFWGDFLGFMFGAEPYTTKSLANRSMLFDARAGDWSGVLMEASGLDRGKFAPIVDSGLEVGTVRPELARELGLADGVAIVSGGHDQGCNSLGCGCLKPGDTVVGMGTYECYTPTFPWPADVESFRRELMCIENHVVDGLFLSFLYSHSGTIVNWFRNAFMPGAGSDAVEILNAEAPEGPTGLLFLPHNEPPQWPRFIEDSSGVFVGLKAGTTRGEMFKAVMEGVAFALVDAVDSMRRTGTCPDVFLASGGTSRSDVWMQIRADVTGIPFTRLSVTEGSLTGAAMLAAVRSGLFGSNGEAVAAYVRHGRTFLPDPGRHAEYRERAALYRRLFPAVHPLLGDLNRLNAAQS